MKIKCTVCNKEFYYGDHNSPMFIDEVWNKIINYFKLTNFEKEAQEWLINNGITDNKSAQSHIIGCCKNKTKSQYGYIWKYLPEPI